VPRRGIGDTSIAALSAAAGQWGKPLLEAARMADRIADLRPNAREGFRGFSALVDGIAARAADLAPAQILEELIRAIDYETVLAAEGAEGADRWENVRELVASAAEWSEVVLPDAEDPGTPLERFLAEAALLTAHENVVGGDGGVTLMTLHTAKGLEWPVVVLAGLEHGLFPLARAEEQADGLEEERRLCYVGLTRAKDKLYLTWARARRRGGELRPGIPSAFLKALPPAIVEERRTSSMTTPGWGGRSGREWAGAVGSRRRATWMDDDDFPAPGHASPMSVAPDQESQLAPRYVKGERVRHRRFGSGTIRGLTGGGRDLKVEVAFDDADVGIKQLLVAYAGLERDWEGA
jgi:DNA helicase-2/ATP-dependent DNA helicase PcrA